jgi:hypothetical protein
MEQGTGKKILEKNAVWAIVWIIRASVNMGK